MTLLPVKRALRRTLNQNTAHNHFVIRKTGQKLRRGESSVGFNELVLFEYARKRLRTLPNGFVHPQNHFRDKGNQRAFMEVIGADLPRQFLCGTVEGISQLDTGQYFIKPRKGSGAKGAVPICVGKNEVTVKGRVHSFDGFRRWYGDVFGTKDVVVEERLEDRFFDHLVDYKAYCFQGSGVDHILCMQRDDGVTGATFFPTGERADTGKYAKSRLALDVPAALIGQIALVSEALLRKIPLSFVRLDFYVSATGIFLGEVTPLPGSSGDFSQEWDRKLGKKWMEARHLLPSLMRSMSGYPYFQKHQLDSF